jgi:predicted NBD/HSP70 family sugar kinase
MRKINLNEFHVATNGTVRDINSRIMLNLVRRHQPVSRADLTRYSGLQRSTVSMIAGRLIADRWLREGAVGNLPRGRRPTFLHLNPDRCGVIGVDVQPARTTLAVSNMESQLSAMESMTTARDPSEFISRLSHRITDLVRAHPKKSYEGVGISLPGRIDLASERLIFAPTLGWKELDLKAAIERNTGLPVKLENAANACALAALWSGKNMDGVENLVAITVSDDISVGMVMNGQLVRGSTGVAGEFGHVSQSLQGPQCRCGNNGCWEVMASNAAAVRYYAESTAVRKGAIGSKSDMTMVSFGDILRLAEREDARACKALNQMAYHLGVGLAMLVTGLAPDVLMVVGEITQVWNRVGPMVADAVKNRCFTHAATRIVPVGAETEFRLRGTVAMVLQKHFNAPSIA